MGLTVPCKHEVQQKRMLRSPTIDKRLGLMTSWFLDEDLGTRLNGIAEYRWTSSTGTESGHQLLQMQPISL